MHNIKVYLVLNCSWRSIANVFLYIFLICKKGATFILESLFLMISHVQ